MKFEISGKSTGVGAFADGFILGHEPDRIEESGTGNHWVHIYKDVPEKAICIEFGYSRSGKPFRYAVHVDGTPVTAEDMEEISHL